MNEALSIKWMTTKQDQRICEALELEQARLRNFIRKRVADEGDAEDILQDVFYELVEAYRLMKPVQQVSAWLFRVARNRITDIFCKRRLLATIHEVPFTDWCSRNSSRDSLGTLICWPLVSADAVAPAPAPIACLCPLDNTGSAG
jgi:DNA-directed RNA polymerase specialized sigma24 family protein